MADKNTYPRTCPANNLRAKAAYAQAQADEARRKQDPNIAAQWQAEADALGRAATRLGQ